MYYNQLNGIHTKLDFCTLSILDRKALKCYCEELVAKFLSGKKPALANHVHGQIPADAMPTRSGDHFGIRGVFNICNFSRVESLAMAIKDQGKGSSRGHNCETQGRQGLFQLDRLPLIEGQATLVHCCRTSYVCNRCWNKFDLLEWAKFMDIDTSNCCCRVFWFHSYDSNFSGEVDQLLQNQSAQSTKSIYNYFRYQFIYCPS